MKVKLMNSAMMPNAGLYFLFPVSREQFLNAIKDAYRKGTLESYLGYEQNAHVLSKLTGIPIPVNRTETTLSPGDIMLVMRLKYRASPVDKGKDVSEEDFEYFIATYS